ncbi:GH25 family lysozyme [Streptomyces sp. NPDC003300]|uniref:GH25 family lysozyme n=1 Tax=unclassified Streptomyces TaxID=2593676 RepID=UPI0033ACADE7
MGTYGQDWASYQSATPSTAGLGFVFVKATEGLGYVNTRRAAQVAHARAAGLVVGHYHYPHMAADPAAEAAYFLAAAQPAAGEILVLDWEGYDAANQGVPMARQIAYKDAFLDRVQAAQPLHQVGTYANADYLSRDPKGRYGDFLWIATADKPAGQPGIVHPWLFHQYGASGVDRDYCPLTPAQLKTWAHAKENDDMPLTDADAKKLWGYKGPGDSPDVHQTMTNAAKSAASAAASAAAALNAVKGLTAPALTDAQTAAIADRLAVSPVFAQALAVALGKDLAARLQS